MSDTVRATLVMTLNVGCPECGHEFDLFSTPDNDEGWLYRQVIDDDRWEIDADDRLEAHAYCPGCGVDFDVKGVDW